MDSGAAREKSYAFAALCIEHVRELSVIRRTGEFLSQVYRRGQVAAQEKRARFWIATPDAIYGQDGGVQPKLAEHRIGALAVEDRWMKLVGIFSERDFINAMARGAAAVLGFDVQELMSPPLLSCRSSDRVDAMLARMTIARVRHLPVMGELKGIASIGDLVKHRLDAKELEASVLLDLSRMRA